MAWGALTFDFYTGPRPKTDRGDKAQHSHEKVESHGDPLEIEVPPHEILHARLLVIWAGQAFESYRADDDDL